MPHVEKIEEKPSNEPLSNEMVYIFILLWAGHFSQLKFECRKQSSKLGSGICVTWGVSDKVGRLARAIESLMNDE